MPMRGKRYRTIEEVKQAAERSLRTINRLGNENGSNDFRVAGNSCTQRWGLHRGPMKLGTI